MKVVTGEQMREIDRITIEERGIAGFELMERAGRAVARQICERLEPESVAVVCGKGNNGGDGFIAATEFHKRGIEAVVYVLFDPSEARGDAMKAFGAIPDEVRVEHPRDMEAFAANLARFDVVVDAILGTGLKGPVRGPLAEAIEAVNRAGANIVSVDIPSGLGAGAAGDEETGGICIQANLTIAIGLPKLGTVLDPGVRTTGLVSIADIGFPSDLLEDPRIETNLLTTEAMRDALPTRDPSGHKGTFGRVLILGGSEGMSGAAILAARSAVRSGTGLVYCAYPRPLGTVMESQLVEPVKIPLAGDAPWFEGSQASGALEEAARVDAVALGPGLGVRPETGEFVRAVVKDIAKPLVVDADALNILAEDVSILRDRQGPTIITPHPGEAGRLLGCSTEKIQSDRLGAARRLSAELNLVAVLKGSQTIVATPDGQLYINPTGNTGLAKGGSGDVLTGLIAGLLAQGCEPGVAAQLGVFVHGVAADRAAEDLGVRAMTPQDVIEALGRAFVFIERG